MPETHCLSHPLCLTTLMEHMCDTHGTPPKSSSKKPQFFKKSVNFGFFAALLVNFGFFAALFALRTLSPEIMSPFKIRAELKVTDLR